MTEIEKLIPESKFLTLTRRKNGTLAIDGGVNFNGGIDPNSFFLRKGLAYVYVLDGEVIKIGETERTMSDRMKDYNRKRKSDSTEGRLMDEVWRSKKTIEVHIMYVENTIEFLGGEVLMNSSMLEQSLLQRYYSLFGRLPKLNFKMGWFMRR